VKEYGGRAADSVKIGSPSSNYDLIKELPESLRGEARTAADLQAFIDYVNAHGGIEGKKNRARVQVYIPVGSAGLITIRTAHRDDNVFAPCVTYFDTSVKRRLQGEQHKAGAVSFDPEPEHPQGGAGPGLIVTQGLHARAFESRSCSTCSRRSTKLDGKTVGVMGQLEPPAERRERHDRARAEAPEGKMGAPVLLSIREQHRHHHRQ